MRHCLVVFLSFLFVACGKEGTVDLTFSIANNNNRTISVNNGGVAADFVVANVIVILEDAHLKVGAEEVDIAEGFAVRFDDAATVTVSGVVPADTYDQLDLELTVADAALAALADEENVIDRTFHIEGEIDLDGDGVPEGIVVYAPAAQEVEFAQAITVEPDGNVALAVEISLDALLAGVDFALADVVDGELSITEDSVVDQTGLVSANVPGAFSFLP